MTTVFNEKTSIKGAVDIGADILKGQTAVIDQASVQLLYQILTTLKKIEYHLSIATDTELKDHDV